MTVPGVRSRSDGFRIGMKSRASYLVAILKRRNSRSKMVNLAVVSIQRCYVTLLCVEALRPYLPQGPSI